MSSLTSIVRQVIGLGLLVFGSALLAFSFLCFTQSMAIGLIMLISGCALAFIGSRMRKARFVAEEPPPYNRFITSVASAIVLIATAFVGFVLAMIWVFPFSIEN